MKLLAYNIHTEFIVMFTAHFLINFHNSSKSVPLHITVQLKREIKKFQGQHVRFYIKVVVIYFDKTSPYYQNRCLHIILKS